MVPPVLGQRIERRVPELQILEDGSHGAELVLEEGNVALDAVELVGLIRLMR